MTCFAPDKTVLIVCPLPAAKTAQSRNFSSLVETSVQPPGMVQFTVVN